MVCTKNYGGHNMKQKQLVLEHKNMMYYSRELVHLCVPKEITVMFYTIVSLVVCQN